MTTSPAQLSGPTEAADPTRLSATPARRLRWWVEVSTIAAFYGLYSLIRDLHGANTDNVTIATHNAYQIIRFERHLHIFAEAGMQHSFIHARLLISGLDDFYGAAHFLAVAAVLIWLFLARPNHYRQWRNMLALCTAAALIGFAFFPVLPPRLLPYAQFHIVDTLKTVGGLWNFSSGPANDVSNQYAAMPSLHTAWSAWCAMAVASACKTNQVKLAAYGYPALTIFCIIVTGNHYFADAAAGLAALAISYLIVCRMAQPRKHCNLAFHPIGRCARRSGSSVLVGGPEPLNDGVPTTRTLAQATDAASISAGQEIPRTAAPHRHSRPWGSRPQPPGP